MMALEHLKKKNRRMDIEKKQELRKEDDRLWDEKKTFVEGSRRMVDEM